MNVGEALENLKEAVEEEKKARVNTLTAFDLVSKAIEANGDNLKHHYEVHSIIQGL